MKYYEMFGDMGETDGWMLGAIVRPDGSQVNDWEFMSGVAVEAAGHLEVEVVVQGVAFDISHGAFGAIVVSENGRKVLEGISPSVVQYIPVYVSSSKSRYWIANILELVDCIDESKSHVERYVNNDPVRPDLAGQIRLIVNLHINSQLANGRHLFRLREYPLITIVSDVMREECAKNGIEGLDYRCVSSSE